VFISLQGEGGVPGFRGTPGIPVSQFVSYVETLGGARIFLYGGSLGGVVLKTKVVWHTVPC
jgi:hypothetical protein